VAFVRPGVVSGGDGIGENEEPGVGSTRAAEPLEEQRIFVIQHRKQAFA